MMIVEVIIITGSFILTENIGTWKLVKLLTWSKKHKMKAMNPKLNRVIKKCLQFEENTMDPKEKQKVIWRRIVSIFPF